MTKGIKDRLLDLFFPPRCLFCGEVTHVGRPACNECEPNLSRMSEPLCKICGKGERDCVCRAEPFGFARCTAPFAYDGRVKNGIITLKREEKSAAGGYFGAAMAERVLEQYGGVPFSSVTYVPAAPDSSRGFNQARLLAEEISRRLNIPSVAPPIKRLSGRPTQHSQNSLTDRLYNAEQSYVLSGGGLSGNILLTDDVMTTGATLDICARLLLKAGAGAVYCVAASATLRQNITDYYNQT